MKRIEAEWRDSHTSDGSWHPIRFFLRKKIRDPRMFSVGFVLADDKTGIVLASSIDPAVGSACGVIAIPRGAIVSTRRVR